MRRRCRQHRPLPAFRRDNGGAEAGSLLIGILLEATSSETLGWLLIVGFCGGFTTFSTFSADAVRLLRAECYTAAAAYVGLSVAVCIVFAAAGMWIGTTFRN